MIATAAKPLLALSGADISRRVAGPGPRTQKDRDRAELAASRIVAWHAENCRLCRPGSRHGITYGRTDRTLRSSR